MKRTSAPRATRNEVLFREVNERVLDVSRKTAESTIEILCECGDEACLAQLVVSLAQYEAVRSVPTRFFVAADHEDDRVERVVESYGNYVIVEKLGEAGDYARRVAPPRR
jgi:hypothetical protein